MTSAGRKLHSLALNLEAAQYLAGWRPESGTLFVPALSEGRVHDDVAVRIGIFGQARAAPTAVPAQWHILMALGARGQMR